MSNWQRWKGIMKCYPFEEKRLAKWQPPYIVQPKYDGFRCRAVPLIIETPTQDSGYILLSSEENVVHSVPHINKELNRLKLTIELDGELYFHGASFEKISSIVSRTINLHQDYAFMQFHVFDIVSEGTQMRRLLNLENLRKLSPWIIVSPFWVCESLEDIMRVYDKLVESAYEGIIVRHLHAPYEKKRSQFIMKFKPKKEDEYKIVGVSEEVSIDGVPKNRLGALICESGDGETFSVGTGFNDEQREHLWNGRDMLIGMNAKVKYQHVTTGRKVPRFPVFVEVVQLIGATLPWDL